MFPKIKLNLFSVKNSKKNPVMKLNFHELILKKQIGSIFLCKFFLIRLRKIKNKLNMINVRNELQNMKIFSIKIQVKTIVNIIGEE